MRWPFIAFADQSLDVIGMTSIFGNVPTSTATRNAIRLAEMAHYKTIVAGGAKIPLVRPAEPAADFVLVWKALARCHLPILGNADARSAAEK